MNSKLENRIQKVNELYNNKNNIEKCHKLGDLFTRVNKLKYKSKNDILINKFLDDKTQNHIKIYYNNAAIASKQFPNFYLHNLKKFLKCIEDIVKHTKYSGIEWDSKWINPVTIASKGWTVLNVIKSILTLKCTSCRGVWSFDTYESSSSLNERYYSYLSKEHDDLCLWKKHQVNLEQYYYLNESNLYMDIERISNELKKDIINSNLKFEISETVKSISIFLEATHLKLPLLAILLLGYQIINEDFVSCTRCFHMTFITKIKDKSYNGHTTWCRYNNNDILSDLLCEFYLKYESKIKNESLNARLIRLQEIISTCG